MSGYTHADFERDVLESVLRSAAGDGVAGEAAFDRALAYVNKLEAENSKLTLALRISEESKTPEYRDEEIALLDEHNQLLEADFRELWEAAQRACDTWHTTWSPTQTGKETHTEAQNALRELVEKHRERMDG